MCVILIVDEKRPSDDMVAKAYDANKDGCGIAYREDGKVKWRKGITIKLEEFQKLCATVPTPYIAHCRISTIGGVKSELCHPFPIARNVPVDKVGETSGHVLFHNGHWTNWDRECRELAAKFLKGNGPVGRWSDSRAMAWYASFYGVHTLDWTGEKVVAFSPDKMEIFGSGWSFEEGVLVSNRHFLTRGTIISTGHNYTSTMCHHRSCTTKEGLDKEGWCPKHDTPEKRKVAWQQVVDRSSSFLNLAPKRLTDGKQEQTGGSGAVIPFHEARSLWFQNKLSNKKFKAACRAVSIDYEGMKKLRAIWEKDKDDLHLKEIKLPTLLPETILH